MHELGVDPGPPGPKPNALPFIPAPLPGQEGIYVVVEPDL